MSEGKLLNLEKTITKKDWVDIVSWISTRWQNLNWTDQEIKSLYENYKLFPKDVMWTTLFEYFKAGNEFFNQSKFFQNCHETWLRLEHEQENHKALPMGDVVSINAGGLIEYLELHGYESFAHACWDSMRKRFKAGRIEKFEEKVAKDFDLNEEWESARARFSEMFPIRRTLEQLKAKREETNGE